MGSRFRQLNTDNADINEEKTKKNKKTMRNKMKEIKTEFIQRISMKNNNLSQQQK